ncbi:Late embryogenesis abundant protein, LEA-14 [Artemisia annua]|uniref:Late embryogenesis abundant protein, LEA-14 n=1 Tax=Artemisia annua TaxID=35608 RepID=A0A2U1Q4T0_ARTAN|nr:Late embryogenesis abundant protein, LEA-14 [Artemisia annua]
MVRRKGSERPFALYYWIIQVLIVLSIVAVVIWLSTRPRSPKFTITNVYTNRNFSKAQQNETIQNSSLGFVLDITNPNNGMTICYVNIIMKLHNDGFLTGSKSVEAFCQGQKKTVTKEMLFDFDQQVRVDGNDGLRVTVETMIKYHIFKWKTKIRHLGFEGFVKMGKNFTENIYLHKTPYVTE